MKSGSETSSADQRESAPSRGGVLIMTAVEAEREAVLRGLSGLDGVDVLLAGVGPAASAASTAVALARSGKPYRLVVSMGIGGGFPGVADIGSLVIANKIIAADLGVETADGFLSVDELGFGASQVAVAMELVQRLAEAMRSSSAQSTETLTAVHVGPVLTVTTATGTAQTAARLAKRVPGAAAEAMEGYGVAVAAQAAGIPVLELRAISNAVGPRDRSAWRIPEALRTLEAAAAALKEVLI
nr:futalosine hydrolase [Paenibacillus sp. YYML68]